MTGKLIFVDVVFPQNIDRLTYILPKELHDSCRAGTIVEAPLRAKSTSGIVINIHSKPPNIDNRKKLSSITKTVHDHQINPHFLSLLKWVSDYYLCTEGLALKNMLLTDSLRLTKARRALGKVTIDPPIMPLPDTSISYRKIKHAIRRSGFKTFLFHAHSILSEISIVMEVVQDTQNVIIIVPEKYDLEYIIPYLHTIAGMRSCVLHGGMSKSAKADAYEGISSGKYDVVLGTMQTVFSPMPDPSVLIVLKEHSEFYKHEETPKYNVRDVAVKRGSLENIPVLLTSVAPSFESYHNTKKGKYTLVEDSPSTARPLIKIINAAGSGSIVTAPLKKAITHTLEEKKDVLLILNRKGHSILQCNDCGHIEMCSHCDVPLVFHTEKILRCHYCNSTRKLYNLCPRCKSADFKYIGTGTEKVFGMLKEEFRAGITLIDSEHAHSTLNGSQKGKIIIGTEFALRKIPPYSQFGLTAILNADFPLHKPDFRAYEKLFQGFVSLSDMNETGGEVFIQTFDWRNPFFGFVKRYDFKGFFEREMPKRQAFNYPPFCKLALLSIKKSALRSADLDIRGKNIELLGPTHKRSGKTERVEFLLKYNASVPIQKYIQKIIEGLAKDKKSLKIDIDPLMFA